MMRPVTKRVLTYTPLLLFLALDVWAFSTGTYASDRDRILPYLFALYIFIYLLPSIIACHRDHSHFLALWLVNLFGGMLFLIGWVIALIWAFIDPTKQKSRLAG